MWWRARLVVPMAAPLIEDGAVLVLDGRVAAVGRWRDVASEASGRVTDLGEVVLLPGLVNTHAHLDYTHFAGALSPPRRFTDWVQGVLGLKAQWSYSEYAASWLEGARQLLASGCTTVLDFEAVPELLPECWDNTTLRVVSALELTGVRSGRSPSEIVEAAVAWVEGCRHPRSRGALGPHAPYSTRPELVRRAAEVVRQRGWVVSMHVAESEDEYEMFRGGSGPMYDWLRAQRDMSDCGAQTPVQRVAEAGLLGPEAVLVHVNYLGPGDAELLGASGCTVVHCPRSHAYFGHAPFPLEALRKAGVRLGLGTDSLMSVRKLGKRLPQLDFRAELTAAWSCSGWSPEEVLRAATVSGGEALGQAGEIGVLRAGAWADAVVWSYEGSAAEVVEAWVSGTGPQEISVMSGGRWVVNGGHVVLGEGL